MNSNAKLLIWQMFGVVIIIWNISEGDCFMLRKRPRHLITKYERDYREDENIASLVSAKSRIDREEATNYSLAQLADQMSAINNREDEISISWDDNKISENFRPSDVPPTVKYNCENPFDILKLWQLLYNINQSNSGTDHNNQCLSDGLQSTTPSNSLSNNKQFDEQLPLSTSTSNPSQVDRPSSLNNRTEKSKPPECDSCQSVKNLPSQLPDIQYEQETFKASTKSNLQDSRITAPSQFSCNSCTTTVPQIPQNPLVKNFPSQLPNIQYEQETFKASTKSNLQDFRITAPSQFSCNSCTTTVPQMLQNLLVQSTSDVQGPCLLCEKSSYPNNLQPSTSTSNSNSIISDNLPTVPLNNNINTPTSVPSTTISQPSQQPCANFQGRIIPIGGLPPNGIPSPTKLPPNTDNNKKPTTDYSIKSEINTPNCCNGATPMTPTSYPITSCPKHLRLKNTKQSENKHNFPLLNYIPLRPNEISGSLIQQLISKYKLKRNNYIDSLADKPSLNYKLMQRQENVGIFTENHNSPIRTFNNKRKTFFAEGPIIGNNRFYTNHYERPRQLSREDYPHIYSFRKYTGNRNRNKESSENSWVESHKLDSSSSLDSEQNYRQKTSYGFINDGDNRQQVYLSPIGNSWKPQVRHTNDLEYTNYFLRKPINNENSQINVIPEQNNYIYEA